MKTLYGAFTLLGACFMALCYGWTYALTVERFPVEGIIGATVPLTCVMMGALAGMLLMGETK